MQNMKKDIYSVSVRLGNITIQLDYPVADSIFYANNTFLLHWPNSNNIACLSIKATEKKSIHLSKEDARRIYHCLYPHKDFPMLIQILTDIENTQGTNASLDTKVITNLIKEEYKKVSKRAENKYLLLCKSRMSSGSPIENFPSELIKYFGLLNFNLESKDNKSDYHGNDVIKNNQILESKSSCILF